MCLEYPPSIRARLGVYIVVLCNNIPAPAPEKDWMRALRFPDYRELNRTLPYPLVVYEYHYSLSRFTPEYPRERRFCSVSSQSHVPCGT